MAQCPSRCNVRMVWSTIRRLLLIFVVITITNTIFVIVSIVMIPITVIIPIIAIITLFSRSMWVLVTSFQELAIS